LKPYFLITIDTEGDNQWARSPVITTKNSHYLPRFQSLCEKFGFKPAWLTNWEMCHCPVYQEFARDCLRRSTAEIGMHLHAWHNPPEAPLTDDDYKHHPYLIEFPEHVLRDKVARMTDALQETFDTKMVSHRAGRWGFNDIYARALVDHGYLVDCSVTPHVSWSMYKGDPNGNGGPDFTNFREEPYFLDTNNIENDGDSPLLEVPVMITTPYYSPPIQLARATFNRMGKLGRKVVRRFWPQYAQLVPNGINRRLMIALVEQAHRQNRDYVEFMLHSSEFLPGGSPTFDTEAKIESLYADLESLFSFSSRYFEGGTLHDYYKRFTHGTGISPVYENRMPKIAMSQ
jgi:hypothetical protein